MDVTINPSDRVPVSEQIAEQVRFAVASGRLSSGERLPSVRGFARSILVNPNTVAKVYRDLEREGVLRTRPGSGVFVAKGATPACRAASRRAVNAALRDAIGKAVAAGLSPAGIEELLSELCAELLEPETEAVHATR